MNENRAVLDAAMSEADVAAIIEGYLRAGGWQWYHPEKGMRANTILDYIAWRERLIWIEIKKVGGRLTKDRFLTGKFGAYFIKGQATLIPELLAAGQEVYVWYPKDLDYAKFVLVDEPRGAFHESANLREHRAVRD